MDGPQGPHQPTPTSWLYMQHLLQQLQDHQQPQQQQQQQQQQQPQHHQQQPLSPHQHQLPHQSPHHSPHHPPPHPQQQLPPPPPPTPPHHHHHHHHQPLPQHHQPLQMQQPPSQQYQHLQQQQYKPPPPPPPPQQQQQQPNKSFARPDDQRYSVESLLAVPRVDLPPAPLHPAPLHPSPLHPASLPLTTLPPAPLPPAPLTPAKVQPDNEMMVMSFLNELEGGKKMQGDGSGPPPPPPPPTLHKNLPSSSFSQVLVREDQSQRGGLTALTMQTGSHLAPVTPHMSLGGIASSATRVNHNGDAAVLPIRPPTTTFPEAAPQDTMQLNPLYPGACEGSGAPLGRLERGDSASSMSQLDLGLSDDSNPLIDQLESALESDSSLPAKTSPESHVPGDISSCSDGARDEGENARGEDQVEETPSQPQTEMFMSLLDNPTSETSKQSPEHSEPHEQPTAASEEPPTEEPPTEDTTKLDTPTEDTEKEETEAMSTEPEKEDAAPMSDSDSCNAPAAPSMDTEQDDTVPPKDSPEPETTTSPQDPISVPRDSPQEATPPPKDTEESSQDPEVIEDDEAPQQQEEEPQQPSEPTTEDSTPTSKNLLKEGTDITQDNSSEDSIEPLSSSPAPLQHPASVESSVTEEPVLLSPAPPSPKIDSPTKTVEIPTVYIVEPKQEAPPPPAPELTPEIVFVTSRVQDPSPPKEDVRPVVKTGVIEVKTKKVTIPRRETHFFESTPVPPGKEKMMVMCYVCDTNVKISQFKSHLFFGFVRCHYCNRRLMGCKLLKEDLSNPDKSICYNSPFKIHSFCKWASDPIEHLSYYIRKELVIKRFCAGKTKPPPVPEIVAEIHSYISKLTVLESFSPWCYAFERCSKYIQERINAEPKAFSDKFTTSAIATVSRINESSSRPNSPSVTEGVASPSSGVGRPGIVMSSLARERAPVASAIVPSSVVVIQDGIVTEQPEETLPVSKPSELVSKLVPVTQPVSEESVNQPICIIETPPVTQSEESVDDPTEIADYPDSDTADDTTAADQNATSRKTPTPPMEHTVKVRTFSSLSQPETPKSSATEPDNQTSRKCNNSTPNSLPITQTMTHVQDMFTHSPASSMTPPTQLSSPSVSKTTTPEATPASQSDVEIIDEPTPSAGRHNIAGTTLVRQWGTKTKTHASASRKTSQAESWPVKNENYLIVKYPSEPCPDVCPSCYATFDPLRATVQCSSFLMTVKCESCKLTLFVSQDPPPPRPRKKRRMM